MSTSVDAKALETVHNHVTEMYAAHKLQPGECIFETALALELNLSRTPVRDALGRLAANGFLEQYPGKRGYFVPRLAFADMKEAFEARESLEEKIGFLAAEKAQKADLALLSNYNEQEIKFFDCGKTIDYMKANDSFHLTMVKVAQNKYIERVYGPIYWRTQLYVYYLGPFKREERELFAMVDYKSDTPHEHAHIIEAVERRDASAAAARCLEHVRSTFAHRLSRQYSAPKEVFNKLLQTKTMEEK